MLGCIVQHNHCSVQKSPLHRCKLNCIQSLKCTAVKYNKSDGTCIEISAPRVLADNDLTMMYIMFNERVHRHCFTWVMRRELIAHHSREVYNRNGKATVARILYNSGFYPANANSRGCYTGTGIQLINTVDNVCEVLVLSPSCTTAWVPYEAGQPIPTRAETAGYTTEGEVTYPVMFAPNGEPDNYLIGYYTAANGYGMLTHTSARHFVSQMMMLVLLWGGKCLKCVHWNNAMIFTTYWWQYDKTVLKFTNASWSFQIGLFITRYREFKPCDIMPERLMTLQIYATYWIDTRAGGSNYFDEGRCIFSRKTYQCRSTLQSINVVPDIGMVYFMIPI